MKKYTYDDPEVYILDDLIRFKDHERCCDMDFVEDTYEFMLEKEFITENQLNVLKRIYAKNKVYEKFPRNTDE